MAGRHGWVLPVLVAAAIGVELLHLNLAQMKWVRTPVAQAGFACDMKALMAYAPLDRLGGWAFVEKMAAYYGEQGQTLRLPDGQTAARAGVYCPFGYLERMDDALMPSLKLHGGGPGISEVVYEFGGEGLKSYTNFRTATVRPYGKDFTIVCESAVLLPVKRRVQRLECRDSGGGTLSVRFVHTRLPEAPLLAGTVERVNVPTCRVPTRFGDVLVLEARAQFPGRPPVLLGARGDGVLTQVDEDGGRPLTVGAWLKRVDRQPALLCVQPQSDRSRSCLRVERFRLRHNCGGAAAACVLLGLAWWLGRRRSGSVGQAGAAGLP